MMDVRPFSNEIKQPEGPKLADAMGPGLMPGASDDGPSAEGATARPALGRSRSWCDS
jgi:hypothetical protein